MEAPDGPLLIFAGAGSGKTRVLTHRIAHVVATGRARPPEILAVTFTNKAAREMRGRVEALVGGDVTGMWLGTFHSIGVRILRRDGAALDIDREFVIYDEADRTAALRRAMQGLGVDEKRWPPARVGHVISAAKNELHGPGDYEAEQGGGYEGRVIAPIYHAYEAAMHRAQALDFDDLLLLTVRLLREVEEVRLRYQERFRHVFVDEYQDTNHAQYVMVNLLSEKHRNITVVGDDDQSIFGWRGADVRNILHFERDHPDARIVTLDRNYRSTQPILDAAHAVIRHNPERAPKRLWTDRTSGQPVRLLQVYDEQEEALAVCAEIETLAAREDVSLSECAVLYRVNAQSRAFEEAMLRRGMPYRLVGGIRFYERREVKDVLAYLRLITNPRDAVSFARVVNVPRRKIGDRTVAELERVARRHDISPFEATAHLSEAEGLNSAALQSLSGFRSLVEGLRADSRRLPLPDLLEAVLDRTGYRRHLEDGTPEGMERWQNVMELAGLASEYSDLAPPEGLVRFLENVALVSDVDSLDRDGSGVTLITLHQVKGLEFPVVFLVGLEDGLLPHLRALDEGEAGIAEERRLAYVGITRAQQRLYLVHAHTRHLYGGSRASVRSRFVADLEHLVEAARRPGTPPPPTARPGALREAIHARAVRPNPVAVAPQRFGKGMRVRHARYGDGTISLSTMTRNGEEVVIHFDDAGPKIFAVADARLEILE